MTTREQADEAARRFVEKAVRKAIESELLAAAHYRRIAEIAPDRAFARRALADAAEEARHAHALGRAARRDGVDISAHDGWYDDLDGVHAAFDACARSGDAVACLFVQDVFLEVVAITLYETLASAAARTRAHAIEALVAKVILPDERRHLAEGIRDIARIAPDRERRAAAFQRASAEILPAMLPFASDEGVPCARTCVACSDRCLKLDAGCGGVSLAGGWSRMARAIEDATRRLGIEASFSA
jgi:rubrerythrin